MAPKIFLTGITGYIGGDAFYVIQKAHPDWEYTALVRSSSRAALVAKDYPKVRFVYGDLSSAAQLEEEAGKADVVLHFADADDETAARAIVKGLAAHTALSPGFLIHTSGTAILLFNDTDRKVFGDENPKTYDDIANIDELNSLPEHALHRRIDKIVQAAASDSVKIAIVCPPTIYDKSRGPGNQRSVQVPNLVSAMIKRGEAFHIGQGKTFWGNVNVRDLSDAYLALTEAAVAGGGKASWGRNGYYFVENGEHRWGDISKSMGRILHQKGLAKTAESASVSAEEASKMYSAGPLLWGANSRSRASRLRQELGWNPSGRPIEETLSDAVDVEDALLKQ